MRIHKRALLTLAALCVPLVASQAAAVGLGAAESAAVRERIPEFSIVVNTSGNENEVVATCTGACAWKRVSARYPQGTYRITHRGIQMVDAGRRSADPAPPSGFSIVVNTVDGGITAACDRGCAWKTVGARYPGGTYRITEKGIEPDGVAASR
jgi:Tfp pilus assembly protein PilX